MEIPIKWQCLSLSFYRNSLYTKITKDLPIKLQNFLFRIVFVGTFFGQFEKCIILSEKKRPLIDRMIVRKSVACLTIDKLTDIVFKRTDVQHKHLHLTLKA